MNSHEKNKSCAHYKSSETNSTAPYRNIYHANCKECVYFSTQNCGMDVADSISPDLNAFY